MSNQGKYNFPQLKKVIFKGFSLYSKNDKVIEINEEINQGVYCLAGANGLGKTTFLNAINYGLTGIVLAPDKEILDPKDIVSVHKRYTERYFQGRVKEADMPKAEIELHFRIDIYHFKIIRGFERRDELKYLEVYQEDGKKVVSSIDTRGLTPKELAKAYEKKLASLIGIESFDYYAFYQLYILTFDENRRMIFWDERASSHALSIAFNTDIKKTERIIELKRQMEKHESNGRNARWQATQIKNEIATLRNANDTSAPSSEELQIEYEKKLVEYEEIQEVAQNMNSEYDAMLKKQSYLTSDIMHLKMEHAKLFSQYTKPRSNLLNNEFLSLALENDDCALCGAHGKQVKERIVANIHKLQCPLCDTSINEEKSDELERILEMIKENDFKIAEKNDSLELLTIEIQGKKKRLEDIEKRVKKLKTELENIVEDNPGVTFKKTGVQSMDTIISEYEKQFLNYDEKAKKEYSFRDKLKPEYNTLLKEVDSAYKEAEIVFVPIFKKLATSFIGLELNIQSQRNSKNIFLILELKSSARTQASQLSESQRFFLDIALRMALAIYLSSEGNGATMFIDTPEGSLDIAYESRVGKMFADFVTEHSQSIIMTANINASQLLVSLAENCKHSNMKFRRMLEWTDPTPIQREGEYLFNRVYENIENALTG